MHRPGPEVEVVDTSKRLDSNAFGDEQAGWYWRGTEGPDLPAMQAQHDAYVAVLHSEGVEVVSLDSPAPGRMKSCYTRGFRHRGRRRRDRDAARARGSGAARNCGRPARSRSSDARSSARFRVLGWPKAAVSPG